MAICNFTVHIWNISVAFLSNFSHSERTELSSFAVTERDQSAAQVVTNDCARVTEEVNQLSPAH